MTPVEESLARPNRFWVRGAGHNNIEMLLRDSGTLFRKLAEFIDYCVEQRQLVAPLDDAAATLDRPGRVAKPARCIRCMN